MSDRLQRKFSAMLRRIQIAEKDSYFFFVEGRERDPHFYEGICDQVKEIEGKYCIYPADTLSAEGGGKQVLISFWQYTKEKDALHGTFEGKSKIVGFFLDKDIDDVRGICETCRHIVYTEYYDVENYLFAHGNLVSAVAASISVPKYQLCDAPFASTQWCDVIAANWKEWIALCLTSERLGLRCGINFSRPSVVQSSFSQGIDTDKLNHCLEDMKKVCEHHTDKDLLDQYSSSLRFVEDHMRLHGIHSIFKGKCFFYAIADAVRLYMGSQKYTNKKSLDACIAASLATSLDFSLDWTLSQRRRILAMMSTHPDS